MAKQSTTATPRAGRRSAAPAPVAKAPAATAANADADSADDEDTKDTEDKKDGGADDDEEDSTGKKVEGKEKADGEPDPEDPKEGDESGEEYEDPKAGAGASASAIEQAKKGERARIAAINALPGPATIKSACIDEGVSAHEAAHRILTAQSSSGTAPSRLAQLRQDDAGAHASATTTTDSTNTTPRDAAKASVDRFYSLTQPAKGTTTRTA